MRARIASLICVAAPCSMVGGGLVPRYEYYSYIDTKNTYGCFLHTHVHTYICPHIIYNGNC